MSIEQSRLEDFLSTEELSQASADALPDTQAAPLDEGLSDVATPDEESIQVAGPVDAATRWVSQRAARAARKGPKVAAGTMENHAGVLITNEADPAVAAQVVADQAQRTQRAATVRARPAVAGGTGGQRAITGAPPTEPLNLDKQGLWNSVADSPDLDSMAAMIQSVNTAYGITQPTVLTHAEVKAKAAQHGLDKVIEDAVTGGMNIDVSKVYTLLDGMTSGAMHLDELAQKIKANPLDAKLAVEFQQALTLQGTLQKTVKGVQVDIARALGVFRIPRQGRDVAAIQNLLAESGGLNNMAQLAERYLMLPTQAAKNKLAERTMSSNVADLWFTTWINGLLSSPITHARNVLGNASFMAYQIPERVVAGVAGNIRHAFGADDFATMGDAWAHMSAIPAGILDGLALGAKSFMENAPTDPIGKIENAMQTKGKLSEQFGVAGDWAKALDFYGTVITLPGRALMSEDEFFKAVAYRSELAMMANRGRRDEYARLLQAGVPDAQAKAQADAWAKAAMDDPTEEMDKAALAAARVATFTKPLDGTLADVQSVLMHPLARLYFPFVRTPANIMLETLKRTPAAFVSPSFWHAVKSGGPEADAAIAKATMGSAIMLGIGATVLGDRITGAGPGDRKRKQALQNQGWQPFSIVFSNDEVTPDDLARFNELTGGMVRVGPDKTYVSYAGIEPLASILAMGASAAETALEAEDMQDAERWVFASSMAAFDYLGKQPMLAGMSKLVSDLGQGTESAKSFFISLLNNIGKTGTGFLIGGSPAGAFQAAARALERMANPEASNTMPPDMNTPAPVKGFWQALNDYRASIPGLASGLPPKLNAWGEPQTKQMFGDARDFVNPFFRSGGKLSEADAIMVALKMPIPKVETKQEFKLQMGDKVGVGTVDLSAEQFNKLLTYTNEVDFGGKTIKRAIVDVFQAPGFASLPIDKQRSTIAGMYSDALRVAREKLFNEDAALREAARANAEWRIASPDTPQSIFTGF